MAETDKFPGWHGTTIIGVKKGGKVVVAGDGPTQSISAAEASVPIV